MYTLINFWKVKSALCLRAKRDISDHQIVFVLFEVMNHDLHTHAYTNLNIESI